MREILHRRTTLGRILNLLAFLLALQMESSLRATETANAAPRITSAHVGLNNCFKLGCWTPVFVELEAGSDATLAQQLRVEVTTSDSDGVPTTAAANVPAEPSSGTKRLVVFTQIGRVGSSVRVALLAGDHALDEFVLSPAKDATKGHTIVPIPPTNELIVSLGTSSYGLTDAFANRAARGNGMGRKVIELTDSDELPTKWFGYDGVDVMLLPVGDGQFCQKLAKDKERFAALARWVELGGRLVILCEGKNATSLLGTDGALASLTPGKLAEVVRIPERSTIEHYAASADTPGAAIAADVPIFIPRLVNVVGTIEAYAGPRPTDPPLVVRTARGFGEITFVSVEFSSPPLSNWAGRTPFLRNLMRPYLREAGGEETNQKLMTTGVTDLSGALRQQLGSRFAMVKTIGFPVVAVLVLVYLVILGPLDYLVTQRWLRRRMVAWITFPAIILLFAAIAVAVGRWSKGSAVTQLNRIELVDFDTLNGQVRGTFWSAVYSPEARLFDLVVKPQLSGGKLPESTETLFSWWGMPGVGIGGMQTTGSDLGLVRSGYRYSPARDGLEQVPVLMSATKSLIARWNAPVEGKLDADLADAEGLIAGKISNRTGVVLKNARLLYGAWAYRLGNVKVDETIEIGDQLSPRSTKTVVTRDALGDSGTTPGAVESPVFSADQASSRDIVKLMMFYSAAGGLGFAHMPSQYQGYCDLSRQLDLGRAIFVGEAVTGGTTLVDDAGQTIGDDKAGESIVIYRFLLPVKHPKGP